MNHVKTVSFDAGGTLLYPWPSVGEIYAERMQAHGMRVDADAVEAVANGSIEVEPLISAVASLNDGGEWFQRLYKNEEGLLKVILTP